MGKPYIGKAKGTGKGIGIYSNCTTYIQLTRGPSYGMRRHYIFDIYIPSDQYLRHKIAFCFTIAISNE